MVIAVELSGFMSMSRGGPFGAKVITVSHECSKNSHTCLKYLVLREKVCYCSSQLLLVCLFI